MDDKTRNNPNGSGPGEYAYRPWSPENADTERRAPDQDAPFIWPNEQAASGEQAVVASGEEGQPVPSPRLVPVPAGLPVPAWEWHGGGAGTAPTPAPSGRYGAPGESYQRPVAESLPGGGETGSWRQTTAGRWI